MATETALIGCGEAGRTFARAGGWPVKAYDIVAPRAAALAVAGAKPCASLAEALGGAHLVLSLVTAGEALAAAVATAKHLAPGTLYCDFNSVAPQTKAAAAQAIEARGGRYVDVAVLAPVEPARLAVPLLVSGPAAREACAALRSLGFTAVRDIGPAVGRASAVKMIRSVMVKGIEALTDELLAGARAAGVVDDVLASLDASERARPWAERAAYNLERMERHGLRRAEEMEQAAATLAALGVDPVMTLGTVRRQRAAAAAPDTRSAA